jgi:uncharacterized protein (TIGR02246 family)
MVIRKRKKPLRLERFIASFLIISCLFALPSANAQAQGKPESEVRALVQGLVQAYLKKDMAALMAVTAEDAELVVQGLTGTLRHQGREKIRAAYAPDLKALRSPTLSMTNLDVKIRDGMAQAVAEVMAGGRVGQEQVAIPARFSALLETRNGKWMVYYAQVRYPLLRPEFDQFLGR